MKWLKKCAALFSVILLVGALGLESASAAIINPDDYGYYVNEVKGGYHFNERSGSYYYVYSPFSTNYQSAYAYFVIPTGLNKASNRNAYISLGIKNKYGIDLGITNRTDYGNVWMPYYTDCQTKHCVPLTSYAAPSSAKAAIITVKPINTTTVHMYLQWVDGSGNHVGTTYDKDISVTSGNLTMQNGKVYCQFYRFASLISPSGDNQADGSYMTGGMIKNCQLYNGSSYVSWAESSSTTANVCFWVTKSKSHMNLTFSGQNDIFNIYHNG